MPDFADKYAARSLASAKAKGATPEELEKRRVELDQFKSNYKNPFYNVAMTFAEPFPVALVITLVVAGVLSRRRSPTLAMHAETA
jgi:multisubunit Na+/H+ antiporter MnhC subunit